MTERKTIKGLEAEIDHLKKEHSRQQKEAEKQHQKELADVTAQADTTAKAVDDNPVAKEMISPTVIAPGHPEVPHYEDGHAVERSFYPSHELPAHARPLDLNPMTNGPFLDEVRAVEAQRARSGEGRKEHVEALAKESGLVKS